jgi:splicing factor U2AF subunit
LLADTTSRNNTHPRPQSYAFLEMRSVEEATNVMAFDGVVFNDTNLKVGGGAEQQPGCARAAGTSGSG